LRDASYRFRSGTRETAMPRLMSVRTVNTVLLYTRGHTPFRRRRRGRGAAYWGTVSWLTATHTLPATRAGLFQRWSRRRRLRNRDHRASGMQRIPVTFRAGSRLAGPHQQRERNSSTGNAALKSQPWKELQPRPTIESRSASVSTPSAITERRNARLSRMMDSATALLLGSSTTSCAWTWRAA